MKTACETLGVLALIAALLGPLFVLAKDERAAPKPGKRAELKGARLTERVPDKARSRGTNTVYVAGRTFPLMFSRPQKTPPAKGPK